MEIISGAMIGHSKYIGTTLNRLIQEAKPEGINPFQFLQKQT